MLQFASEADKYRWVWDNASPHGKSHGLELWEAHREIFGAPQTAVDLGCGRGRLVERWLSEGIDGWGVDIAPNSIDDDAIRDRIITADIAEFTGSYDLAVCTDVLEHIPAQRLEQTVSAVLATAPHVVLKIANFESHFKGVNLHPTMRPREFWLELTGGELYDGYRSQRDEFVIVCA